MAGDWIRTHISLPREPKVAEIAARCGVSIPHAVGAMMVFSLAFAETCTLDTNDNGRGPMVSDAAIGMMVGGVPGFAEAMRAVGWLSVENNQLVFHNFGTIAREYVTLRSERREKSDRQREANRERKQRQRQRNATTTEDQGETPDVTPDVTPNVTPLSRSGHAPVTQMSRSGHADVTGCHTPDRDRDREEQSEGRETRERAKPPLDPPTRPWTQSRPTTPPAPAVASPGSDPDFDAILAAMGEMFPLTVGRATNCPRAVYPAISTFLADFRASVPGWAEWLPTALASLRAAKPASWNACTPLLAKWAEKRAMHGLAPDEDRALQRAPPQTSPIDGAALDAIFAKIDSEKELTEKARKLA